MELLVILLGIIILLLAAVFFVYRRGVENGRQQMELLWQQNLVKLRGDIADKQRVTIKGKVAEAFAPFLGDFPFKPSECKFIGDPIDYVVFEGLDERNITGVHFVEVKSGSSSLSKHQKQIKDLINGLNDKNVTFRTFEPDKKD